MGEVGAAARRFFVGEPLERLRSIRNGCARAVTGGDGAGGWGG